MRRQSLGVLLVAVIAIAAFGAGYLVRGIGGVHATMYVGDGHVGADQATFEAAGTYFGMDASVAWTDDTGTYHDGGWPSCLPKEQVVSGVRFAGATIWSGDIGQARVTWVDCQVH